ncbi:cob(I)yrinic acid a,c-diamide adenosyltransferase [Thermodesulfobacteriota bacterium]
MAKKTKKGLIIVHTGNGKGKTTAAMGMALRGAGYHFKTLMIQFIKGSWSYGELDAVRHLHPHFQIKPMGKGFIRTQGKGLRPQDVKAIQEAWEFSKKNIFSGELDMIILDEITYVIDGDLIPLDRVLDVLNSKPPDLHLVLTGRDAPQQLIERADLVTEMKEVKHPFRKGIKAQKGVEF